METSFSDAKHAVVHAQNDKSCLRPIETCNSDANRAVLNEQNDE